MANAFVTVISPSRSTPAEAAFWSDLALPLAMFEALGQHAACCLLSIDGASVPRESVVSVSRLDESKTSVFDRGPDLRALLVDVIGRSQRDGEFSPTLLATLAAQWSSLADSLGTFGAVANDGVQATLKIDAGRRIDQRYMVLLSGGLLGDEYLRRDGAALSDVLDAVLAMYGEFRKIAR